MTAVALTSQSSAAKSVAIMQPTFLPWVGYFALMDSVDRFIFLDDVQFDKRSWQQRNRIKTGNGPLWLSVPVLTKGRRDQTIADVQLHPDLKFSETALKTLEHSYAKAPYFEPVSAAVKPAFYQSESGLCALNIALIEAISGLIGLQVDCVLSSQTPVTSSKAQRLADLCQHYGATDYISPPGSRDYLEGDTALETAGISLSYFTYDHPIWPQLHGAFEPYMCTLDLLMNDLPNALSIIRSGVRAETLK